jgi:hypothetical protein
MTAAEFGRFLAEVEIDGSAPANVEDLRVSARIPPDAPNFAAELFYLRYFLVCTSVEACVRDNEAGRVTLLQAFTNELLRLASAGQILAVPVSVEKLIERYVGYNRVWQSAWQRYQQGAEDQAPQTAVAWTFLVTNGAWPPQTVSDMDRQQVPEEVRAARPEVEDAMLAMRGMGVALLFMETWIGLVLPDLTRLLKETVIK